MERPGKLTDGESRGRRAFLSAPTLPAELLGRWQGFADLVARLLNVRAVLVTRLQGTQLDVLVASRFPGSPHKPGDSVRLEAGHFCEAVFQTRREVIIDDARDQERWAGNPCFRQGLIAYHGIPILAPDGTLFGALCTLDNRAGRNSEVARDTVRRLSEQIEADLRICEELDRSHREADVVRGDRDLVSAILDTADALVVVLDDKGRIVRFNRACERATKYRSDEVIGKRLWDLLLLPEEIDPVKKVFAGLRNGAFPNQHENCWLTRDGERRLIVWSNTALVNSIGEVTYVIGTGLDVTEERKAQQEKERLQEYVYQLQRIEAVSRLAVGVAHDFNNMLTVILSCSDRLQKTPNLDAATRKNLFSSIDETARQASKVTGSLLALSRGVPTERHPVSLATLIEESRGLLRSFLPAKVELRLDLASASLLTVSADRAHLQQVLINLAINAGDAMPDGGVLSIALSPAGAEDCGDVGGGAAAAIITVRDTGAGMPPEVQAKIFDPFFTTKPRGCGTGLGLAIVDSIVKAHGGRIRVNSQAGRGTTFEIVFPCVSADSGGPDDAGEGTFCGGGESVLLVEGGARLRGVITQALRRAGYRLISVSDCAAAQARLSKNRGGIRAVVLDLDHVTRQELDWIRSLRAAGVEVPVVVIAGVDAMDDESRDVGAVTFLTKPFHPADLAKTIHRMLRRHPVREEVLE